MTIVSSPGSRGKAWLIALAATVSLSPFTAFAQSAGDLVRVEVRVQSEQDRAGNKGTTVDTVTQSKTLIITINGKAKSPETRKGTWIAYGRELKPGSDLSTLEQGEFKVDLAAGPQKVESKTITTKYTPEHYGEGGNRGKNNKVQAEGKKFAGYVVTVKEGDKVVGQISDPPGLQSRAK